MTSSAKKLLAACPLEWTDWRDVEKAILPDDPGMLSRLERAGLIEVRQAGNPQRVQIRRKAVGVTFTQDD